MYLEIYAYVVSGIVLFLVFSLVLKPSYKRFLNFRKGKKGEKDARSYLKKNGFVILEEQKHFKINYLIDKTIHTYSVYVDYLCSKHNKVYAVEVKSGYTNATCRNKDTRRQCIDYYYNLPTDGLYLLDMSKKEHHLVEFKPKQELILVKHSFWSKFVICLLIIYIVIRL